MNVLRKKIKDEDLIWLISEVINSFLSENVNLFEKKGLPIGNLTSQLFANVYLNELDQFVKNNLKVKYYARYTDDFVIISKNENYLKDIIEPIQNFLENRLKLELHPGKVLVRKVSQGIDFLGYVVLPYHKQLRTKTKRRIIKKIKSRADEYRKEQINEVTLTQSLNSYLGVLSHANMHNFSEKFLNSYWFWLNE